MIIHNIAFNVLLILIGFLAGYLTKVLMYNYERIKKKGHRDS